LNAGKRDAKKAALLCGEKDFYLIRVGRFHDLQTNSINVQALGKNLSHRPDQKQEI